MRQALLFAVGMGSAAGLSGPVTPAAAFCSVFDKQPCTPTFCSVFRRGPCIPEFDPPIGQDLRLTIETPTVAAADVRQSNDPSQSSDTGDAERKLDSIRDLFVALRGCWVPPPAEQAREGMQMSVRLSFKRSGEIIGSPRVTYTTPDAPRELRDSYHDAITAALGRCTPLPFTAGMGGAIAGRPINIRFVDNREQKEHP
jgi:hypothetical protein